MDIFIMTAMMQQGKMFESLLVPLTGKPKKVGATA